MNPKKLAVLALMGAAFSQQPREKYDVEMGFEPPTKETGEEKAEMLEQAQIRNFVKQGLKQFNYNGRFVWALNQHNADRKAKNLGYL